MKERKNERKKIRRKPMTKEIILSSRSQNQQSRSRTQRKKYREKERNGE
jgi:hypothetical protein